MSTRISAIICTYNRADYIRKAIRSLVDQTLPKEQYEILVVDNSSTDNTRQVVVEEFCGVQNLRYLYEPILGLSQARNTGYLNARGEYVAYLDDDAITCPQWLEKILEVFDTVKPQPGCVSGKVDPIWEAPQPPWLSDRLVHVLAVIDWSDTPIALTEKQWPIGANIAFPKYILELLGGFQVELGRRGNKLISMEEVVLQRKLESRGYRCFYHPEVAVWHHIQPHQLTKGWFMRRAYWQGISDATIRIHQKDPPILKRLRMVILNSIGLLRSPKQLANLMIPTDNPNRFTMKYTTLMRVGYIVGLLGIAK